MGEVRISNRLQYWRKKKGLTQQELIIKTGISISLLQKLEQGKRDIGQLGSKTLLVLSKALDVTMEQLIQEE